MRSSAGSATTPLHTGRGWRPASKIRPPNGTNPIKKGPPRWTRRRVTNRQPVGYALFFRAGSANNARNVNSDGTLNRNNAYNGNNGLRPASMDSPTY